MLRALCAKASEQLKKTVTVAFLPLLYVPSEPDLHSLIDDVNHVLEDATVQSGHSNYYVMSHVVTTCHEGRAGNITVNGIEMFSPTFYWGSRTSSHLDAKFLLSIRENLKEYIASKFTIGNKQPEFHVKRKFIRDDSERCGSGDPVPSVSHIVPTVAPARGGRGDSGSRKNLKRTGKPWGDVDLSRAKVAKLQAKERRDKKLEDALKILSAHEADINVIKQTLDSARNQDSNRSVSEDMSSCNLNTS